MPIEYTGSLVPGKIDLSYGVHGVSGTTRKERERNKHIFAWLNKSRMRKVKAFTQNQTSDGIDDEAAYSSLVFPI